MPPGVFPLSKSPKRSYRLGAAYRWRVVKFDALGHAFRLLIAYRTDVDEFKAILGMDVSGDTRIVADLGFHGTHPGWHAHADCGDLKVAPVGVQRWPGMRRYPKARNRHRNTSFTSNQAKMNDVSALQIATDRFKLHLNAGSLFARVLGTSGRASRKADS